MLGGGGMELGCLVVDLRLVASETLAKSATLATSAASASEEKLRAIILVSKDSKESHRIFKDPPRTLSGCESWQRNQRRQRILKEFLRILKMNHRVSD